MPVLAADSEVLDKPVKYARRLREQGYQTPAGILDTGCAEVLSKDCGLPIATARGTWQ